MDQCVHKIEQQLRQYKERVQNHKGDPSATRTRPPRGRAGPSRSGPTARFADVP